MTTAPITSAAPDTPDQPKPKNIAEAAKQFEAILIAQMLRSVQEGLHDSDAAGSSMLDMASQHFAQVLANNGGLGLSNLIVKGLGSR